MRIGQGIDVHRFGEGSSIRLGGVDIPFEKGIEAHSDGDVVLHAFYEPVRAYYMLEQLWGEAPIVDPGLPDDVAAGDGDRG